MDTWTENERELVLKAIGFTVVELGKLMNHRFSTTDAMIMSIALMKGFDESLKAFEEAQTLNVVDTEENKEE